MDKTEVYETLNKAYFSVSPHEKDVVERLPMLVKDGSLIVDVGASLGQYTNALCKAVAHSELWAVEADPIRVEQLHRNCARWARNTTNTIVVKHLALRDHAGPTEYFVTNSDVSGGLTRHETPREVQWEEIVIDSSTLDDLFPVRPPDFVKIDVEGAELAVLRGASRIVALGRTMFLIEIHDSIDSHGAGEARALLRRAGYGEVSFYGQPLFMKSRRLWLRLKMVEMLDLPRVVKRLRAKL